MVALLATDILNIVVLLGSFAFGVEAMFIGMGGRLMVEYRRGRRMVLFESALIGLSIAGCAVLTSWSMGLDPPFMALFLAVYTGIAGALIRLFSGGCKERRVIQHEMITDDELKGMLERKGLKGLVDRKRADGD
ncbi:MAG: hypothetical protein QXG10_03775 [Candidatus Hadarchaeales archaeon]